MHQERRENLGDDFDDFGLGGGCHRGRFWTEWGGTHKPDCYTNTFAINTPCMTSCWNYKVCMDIHQWYILMEHQTGQHHFQCNWWWLEQTFSLESSDEKGYSDPKLWHWCPTNFDDSGGVEQLENPVLSEHKVAVLTPELVDLSVTNIVYMISLCWCWCFNDFVWPNYYDTSYPPSNPAYLSYIPPPSFSMLVWSLPLILVFIVGFYSDKYLK